jgi:peptidyl-prolyl cis-trans isomerase C
LLVVATITAATACRKPPAASSNSSTTAGKPAAAGDPGKPAAAPAPAKPMPAQLPPVLARVNGEEVTKVDFDRLITNMELGAKQPVPAERRDEIFRQALDQLVTYTVLTQETRARKVAVTDAEVESNIKQMRSQFPNEQEFAKALAARGMSLEKLKADTRIDISINKMMEAEAAAQQAPTDAQVREFYDKNPDKFKQEETVRASHILIRVDEKADAAAKQKARAEIDSVLKQARAGADFAKLAQEHSQDGSAAQGGDLGWVSPGTFVPEFEAVINQLPEGGISDPVVSRFGVHLVQVTARRDVKLDRRQQREQARNILREQKFEAAYNDWMRDLRGRAYIEMREPPG